MCSLLRLRSSSSTRGSGPAALTVVSDDIPEGQSRSIRNNIVGPDFFAAMGIPVVQGRSFGPQDTENSQKVAVISESMAQRFFPNGSPVGKRFGIDGPNSTEAIEVIGVVKDAKFTEI